MKIIKAKKRINNILKDSVTKGTFYNTTEPIRIWQAIFSVLEENNLAAQLSYKSFITSFEIFQKDHKISFEDASNTFLLFLSGKSTSDIIPNIDVPIIPKTKRPKKIKRTRMNDLLYYEDLYKGLKRIEESIPLMTLKSYDLEKNKSDDEKKSLYYIVNYYGIDIDDKNFKILKKNLDLFIKINSSIVDLIIDLKDDLAYSVRMLLNDNKVPEIKTWFVDVFGEASGRYLNNWQDSKRRSHNKPDFEKSYKIFVKHIEGATTNELGYNRKVHILRYIVVPQGKIMLLFQIYKILYSGIDEERAFLGKKTNQIKKILSELSEFKARNLLNHVLSEYTPKSPKTQNNKPAVTRIHKLLYSQE